MDLIGAIKSNPNDARNGEVPKAEAALAKLDGLIESSDFTGATEAAYWLDRILFNLRALEVAPFVQAGRKQRASLKAIRDAHNAALHSKRTADWAAWNREAMKYWKPGTTKNNVARWLKRDLGLMETVGSIARRLKKPQQAS